MDKVKSIFSNHEATSINPVDLISKLINLLSSRERDVISRRFGLNDSQKETLESIGKSYKITRERVRQIESDGIKKLKKVVTDKKDLGNEVKQLEDLIVRLMDRYCGIMEEEHLIETLFGLFSADLTEQENRARKALLFAFSQLSEKVNKAKLHEELYPYWAVNLDNFENILNTLKEVSNYLENEDRLLDEKELLDLFANKEFYKNHPFEGSDLADLVLAHIRLSKNIEKNILDKWGLISWNTVKPKKMNDKVFLVLKKAGKPLHFNEVAESINQAKFDKKVACPATVHNELILDDKYVLVGRGMYALKDWGYTPGTVSDVIKEVLEETGKPLNKDEIIKKVLDKRFVRKPTIYLALMDKTKFEKLPSGQYQLIK